MTGLLLLTASDFVASRWYAEHAYRHLDIGDTRAHDAAVVLFGDFSASGVDDETQRRLGVALALFETGRIGHIVCVGGKRRDVPRSGALLMRDYLEAHGIPRAATVVGDGSYDTRTNLREVARVAHSRNWRSVALISSPLHLWRARSVLGTMGDAPAFAFAPYDYARATPALGTLELLRQVHYEWLVFALEAVLGPERVTALARFLRRAGDLPARARPSADRGPGGAPLFSTDGLR